MNRPPTAALATGRRQALQKEQTMNERIVEVSCDQIERIDAATHRYEVILDDAKVHSGLKVRVNQPDGSSNAMWIGERVGSNRWTIVNMAI